MILYTVEEILSYKNQFKELPYPGFSLAEIARAQQPHKLIRSATAYIPRRARNADEAVTKQVQSALNKLSPDNYVQILTGLQNEQFLEEAPVQKFVELVFCKALQEPAYSMIYARLCYDMARYEVQMVQRQLEDNADGGSPTIRARSRFRDVIVERTQKEFEFENDDREMEEVANCQDPEEKEELLMKIVRRKKANIKFVGQLFLNKVLSERIMASVLNALIHFDNAAYRPPEIDIEVACELLMTVGEKIDAKPEGVQFQEIVFNRLKELANESSETSPYKSRIRFKMMDTMDVRNKGWYTREEALADMRERHASTRVEPQTPTPGSRGTPTLKGGPRTNFPTSSPKSKTSANVKVVVKANAFPDAPAAPKAPVNAWAKPGGAAAAVRQASAVTSVAKAPMKPEKKPTLLETPPVRVTPSFAYETPMSPAWKAPAGGSHAFPSDVQPPKAPLSKRIDELLQELINVQENTEQEDGEKECVRSRAQAMEKRFCVYQSYLPDEVIIARVVAAFARDACTTTRKNAQAQIAAILREVLEVSTSELLRGLVKTLCQAVEQGLQEDIPKFNSRLVALLGHLTASPEGSLNADGMVTLAQACFQTCVSLFGDKEKTEFELPDSGDDSEEPVEFEPDEVSEPVGAVWRTVRVAEACSSPAEVKATCDSVIRAYAASRCTSENEKAAAYEILTTILQHLTTADKGAVQESCAKNASSFREKTLKHLKDNGLVG